MIINKRNCLGCGKEIEAIGKGHNKKYCNPQCFTSTYHKTDKYKLYSRTWQMRYRTTEEGKARYKELNKKRWLEQEKGNPLYLEDKYEYQKQYMKIPKMREWRRNYDKVTRDRDRIKIKAKIYTWYHKLTDDHCHWCNGDKTLNFHHTNYIKMTGFTLCRQCHNLLHKGMMLGWA